MENLTAMQEARLRCLEMANRIESEMVATKTSAGISGMVISRAEEYLDYVLEGEKSN